MKAGTVLVYPADIEHHGLHEDGRPEDLRRPRADHVSVRRGGRAGDALSRAVPACSARGLDAQVRSPGQGLGPAREGAAAGSRQLVGHVHHRLHDPDRPLRRLVHVPLPQGQGRRGLDPRRRGRAGGHRRGRLVPGSPLEPYFSLSRDGDGLRAGGLWLRRRRPAGLAARFARATIFPASSRSARSFCW